MPKYFTCDCCYYKWNKWDDDDFGEMTDYGTGYWSCETDYRYYCLDCYNDAKKNYREECKLGYFLWTDDFGINKLFEEI